MTKNGLILLYGILIGVLIGGAILLIARPASGIPIILEPAPTTTRTSIPTPTPTLAPIMVQIGGHVTSPGVYSVPKNIRLDALIDMAGGLTAQADEERINLAAVLKDGDYYFIPAKGEIIPETASNAPGRANASEVLEFEFPLDLNSASLEALETLPGIGPTKAGDIIAYREEHGPFQTLEDLVNVPGIGPTTLEAIRDFLILKP